jgi:hypothetical protein
LDYRAAAKISDGGEDEDFFMLVGGAMRTELTFAKTVGQQQGAASFPRKRGSQQRSWSSILILLLLHQKQMDYTPLLRRALRAGCAVRSGILPPQSRLRGNDGSYWMSLALGGN